MASSSSTGLLRTTLLPLLLGVLTALATLSAADQLVTSTLATPSAPEPTASSTRTPPISEQMVEHADAYKEALKPVEGAFDSLADLYRNSSINTQAERNQREKRIVEFLSNLPQPVKDNLPVPAPFTKFGKQAKKELMSVYYAASMSYDKKFAEIEKLVKTYPKPDIKFKVDVTIEGLDGHYSYGQMEDLLTPEQMAQIQDIQKNLNLTDGEREYAIGRVFTDVYANESVRASWPAFYKTELSPRVYWDAINNLYFEPSSAKGGKDKVGPWLKVYKQEVEPYLPNGPLAKRYQKECYRAATTTTTTTTTASTPTITTTTTLLTTRGGSGGGQRANENSAKVFNPASNNNEGAVLGVGQNSDHHSQPSTTFKAVIPGLYSTVYNTPVPQQQPTQAGATEQIDPHPSLNYQAPDNQQGNGDRIGVGRNNDEVMNYRSPGEIQQQGAVVPQ